MNFPGFPSSDDYLRQLAIQSAFRRSGGRGGVPRRRAEAADTAAAEAAEADEDFDSAAPQEPEEAGGEQAPKPDATLVLSPSWIEEKVFFNTKATAQVEASLPPESAHLTRIEMTLFALHPDGPREKLATQEASLSGGKATCEFTAFIPSFKENGELPKACEYVFTAKHSLSKETESPPLKGESRPMAWLRLKLEAAFQGPLANRDCTLKIAGESHEIATDAKGVLAKFVPADAESAEILVKADEKNRALTLSIAIDKLDPPGQPKGARDRLDSMGYLPGPDAERPTFRKALEEFQCDSRLAATGELDGATEGKLKEAFGC